MKPPVAVRCPLPSCCCAQVALVKPFRHQLRCGMTACPAPCSPALQKREIEGNPKRYLGANIWCRPYPNATFQDACLGFYDKKDRNASTTWFMSPVK